MSSQITGTDEGIHELVEGVHWEESRPFLESFDSQLFQEKVHQDKIKPIERKQGNKEDDVVCYPSEEELTFLMLYGKINLGYGELSNLLMEVYVDDGGRNHVPRNVHNKDLNRVVRGLLHNHTTELVKLVFPDNPNKYQRFREKIRTDWAKDIAQMYSVSKLLNFNPIREECGSAKFEAFCDVRAKNYLSDLLRYKNELESRRSKHMERWASLKRYSRDVQSIAHKPRLVKTTQMCDTNRDDGSGSQIQEDYFNRDVTRFLNHQTQMVYK